MEGDWEAVVTTYEDQPWAGREKITKGNTALHIAVLDRQESIVQKLVQVIGNQKDVLDIKKEQGDTPLHLAAAIGNVSMCLHIACGHPYLVGVCNKELETPLFVAARHGKIGAFFCLLDMSGSRAQFYGKLRNKNGETILHCAIAGGHSKLAYLMALQYEDLVNTISDRGASPLHLRANKPTAFRSGTHLSPVDKLIYHCILVPEVHRPLGDDKNSKKQTRTDLLRVLWSKINVFTDPNWSLLPRLGKASIWAEPIIVAAQAAKKLDDELLLETKMKTEGMGVLETPILITEKNGIKEMVERILDLYPMAIHDIDSNKKNIVLLAVENRHPYVYELFLKRNIVKDSVFGAVDNKGNSALHLAAMFADYRPWLTPGVALQMQWEVKWYEYVKKSMPPNFFRFHKNENESAKQIFTREHKDLVQKGGQWLNNTATSCSLVATLIATVAFATSTAVPGGTKEGSGKPNLE
ncbi:hypothetical protein VitviT2T_019975 [Vitis vinifera]|uniref:PGG domain-containing protein n=2 Tax=Vitis vinifera TaxID=29760 RepID=A0ABY9D2W9_VITVI|nr:hypothetical protein VitviT2T_019975 [Vitis vinifera]